MYENRAETEKVILVGVVSGTERAKHEALASIDELSMLCEAAGAEVICTLVQDRDRPHPATFIGKGKVEELKDLAEKCGATGIVCDDELSPAQMRNLENALNIKVMDRTLVILDIFAARASSKEGKLQVELAQLRYNSSHLIGMRSYMSRLAGGIGTRGPGEKKLEIDRRLIADRISSLKAEVSQIAEHRNVQRKQRMKSEVPQIAIVGYTNAGKSTLLNRLTEAGVLEKNMLFATLDTTTRTMKLDSGKEVLLTDTVGFVRKLPHHLIDAFKSTLEEAKYADVIIHVVDASGMEMSRHMEIVYDTLKDLGVTDRPVITLFNKMDMAEDGNIFYDDKAKICLNTALAAENVPGDINTLEDVKKAIEEVLRSDKVFVERLYSYADAGKIQQLRKVGEVISEEYREDGIFVQAYVPHFR